MIIKPDRPLRRWLLVMILALVLVGVGWGMYQRGLHRAQQDDFRQAIESQSCLDRQATLEQANQKLRGELALLERERQIDNEAHAAIQQDLRAQQDELLALNEEVAFYRGIVSATDKPAGLNIQAFELMPLEQGHLFRYQLVLTQVLKNAREIRGKINLRVEGTLDGKVKQLALRQLGVDGKATVAYRFRYFQRLEGELMLPEGFQPSRVDVIITPGGKKKKSIRKTYQWAALLSE